MIMRQLSFTRMMQRSFFAGGCTSYSTFTGQLKSPGMESVDGKSAPFVLLRDFHMVDGPRVLVLHFMGANEGKMLVLFVPPNATQVTMTNAPGTTPGAFLIGETDMPAMPDEQLMREYDQTVALYNAIEKNNISGIVRLTGTATIGPMSYKSSQQDFLIVADLQSAGGDVIKGTFTQHEAVTTGEIAGDALTVILAPIWVPALVIFLACGGSLVSI